jgi:hypothetical protein
LEGKEPLDYTWNWMPADLYELKGGKKVGDEMLINDPELGPISVNMYYDKVTRLHYFVYYNEYIHEFYYLKNNNGNPSEMTINPKNNDLKEGHFEQFTTQNRTQARNGYAVADGMQMAVWYTTVTLTTGGISSSGVFGATFWGKFGASLTEDFLSQNLTTGFNYKKWNITSFGANAFSARWRFGYLAKNLVSSLGELKIENKHLFSAFNPDFNVRNATISAGIGIAFDGILDGLRSKPDFDMSKYTRYRNLSYKPKFQSLFESLNTSYSTKLDRFNATVPVGVGVMSNTVSTEASNALPDDKKKQ